jgi:hypothetical protein
MTFDESRGYAIIPYGETIVDHGNNTENAACQTVSPHDQGYKLAVFCARIDLYSIKVLNTALIFFT